MPAALDVMMTLLPSDKYRVHVHTPWQDEHAPEVTGLDAKAKLALDQHAEAFAHLRRDDTCPICLEALPPPPTAITKHTPREESVRGVGVNGSTHADVSTTHASMERFQDGASVDTLVNDEEEKADTPTTETKADRGADASTPQPQEPDSSSLIRGSLTIVSDISGSIDSYGNKSMDSGTGAAGFLTLPCGHAFHTNCSSKWFARSTKCPTCRLKLTSAHVEGAAARLKCLLLEQKNCSIALPPPSSSSSSSAVFPTGLKLETDLRVPCGPLPPLIGVHNDSSTVGAATMGSAVAGSNAPRAGIVKVASCNLDDNYENRLVDLADDAIEDSSLDDFDVSNGAGGIDGVVSACGKDLAWLVAETVKAGAEAEAAAQKGAAPSGSAEAEEESDLEEVDEDEEEAQAGWRRLTWSALLLPVSPSRALTRNPTSPASARRALPPMTPNSAPPAYARAASAPVAEPRPSLFRRARDAATRIRPSLSFEIRDPVPTPDDSTGGANGTNRGAAEDNSVAATGSSPEAWPEAATPTAPTTAASAGATSQPAVQSPLRMSYRARFLAAVRGR